MIYIYVRSPVGRRVYVSGDYDHPTNKATPLTLTLPAGTYTIEAVSNGAVDFRARVRNVPDETNVDLDLDPVELAEPIA